MIYEIHNSFIQFCGKDGLWFSINEEELIDFQASFREAISKYYPNNKCQSWGTRMITHKLEEILELSRKIEEEVKRLTQEKHNLILNIMMVNSMLRENSSSKEIMSAKRILEDLINTGEKK